MLALEAPNKERMDISAILFSPWMINKLMKETHTPSIDEFIKLAQEMGVKMVPCSTSCGLMGLPEDAFREGVMSLAGAAFFLNEARQSKTTLFI